ncbi:winged helix-turn-helix transcriptional regulator, partial [Streptomyces sp. BF23-19]|uniref:winged helix-turn-helix transcriptional regulator n=1 Tax=unclassified Streptomyces TaxID=2593676 RepID=UPI0034E42145
RLTARVTESGTSPPVMWPCRSMPTKALVARRVEPTVPPRVFYRLTGLGLSLEAALAGLRTWAEEHMVEIDRANEAAAQEADEE